MASTASHTLCLTLVQIFTPSRYDGSGVAEDGAGKERLAEIDVLFGRRYEDVEGLVWGSNRVVGFRGFIAGPGGIDGTGGICRGQLEEVSHTMGTRATTSSWSLEERTGFSIKMPVVMMRRSAMITKDRRRKSTKVPRPSNI